LEIFGRHVLIRHDPTQKSNFYEPGDGDTDTLVIGGDCDMLERRIRDFVKKEFMTRVREIVRAAPPEFQPTRIVILDTRSQWGSCAATGRISFSWRLAFAPPPVMRYVIMHELAHRMHMDHSPAFWATVAQLYGDGVGRAKRWLTIHGTELHQIL
jgi:predicted metal-dependent hydrolase